MASDVAPIERLEDHPIAVDAHAIEEEFTRIWRETSGAGYDESSIRVRVLNLVAIAFSDADLDRFEDVMGILPQRHPCRGILAVAAKPHTRLGATISARCWRSGGAGRHVCSEEVLLSGAPGQERELASAVLGLLVPELPVDVWIMDEIETRGGDLAARLLEAADAVIFDSAHCRELRSALAAALDVREQHRVVVSDLAWCRLADWRALVAQMFDGEAGARELSEIVSVEIAGAGGAASSEALLLASWLASRLNLEPADTSVTGDSLDATMYDGAKGVRLRVVPGQGGFALESVRIRTTDAQFVVERHPQSGHVHVREDWDSGSTRRIVDRPAIDDGSVIAMALDGSGDGPVFEESLRMALALLS